MKKRGASHVEIILSFIMFITAVGFGLYFFNPSNTTRNVDIFLDYSLDEILDNTTINIETFSVRVGNSNNQIQIQNTRDSQPLNSLVVEIAGICGNINTNSLVFDYAGDILPSVIGIGANCRQDSSRKDFVYLKKETAWDTIDAEFISIVSSQDIDRPSQTEINSIGNPSLNDSFFVISYSDKKKIILEEKIINLNKTYEENYVDLKKEFNLPGRIDFGFSLTMIDGETITAEKPSRKNSEVFSSTKRVQVLRNNTKKIEFADLVVSVW